MAGADNSLFSLVFSCRW